MSFSWVAPLTVRGEEIPIASYPRMENPWTRIPFESKDLYLEDAVNGTALWHDFEGGKRFLFSVD